MSSRFFCHSLNHNYNYNVQIWAITSLAQVSLHKRWQSTQAGRYPSCRQEQIRPFNLLHDNVYTYILRKITSP